MCCCGHPHCCCIVGLVVGVGEGSGREQGGYAATRLDSDDRRRRGDNNNR